jgi:hypothetical protein
MDSFVSAAAGLIDRPFGYDGSQTFSVPANGEYHLTITF